MVSGRYIVDGSTEDINVHHLSTGSTEDIDVTSLVDWFY